MLRIFRLIIMIIICCFALPKNLFAAPQIKSAVFYKLSDLIVIDGSDLGEFKDTGTFVVLNSDTKLAINKWTSTQILCYPTNNINPNSKIQVQTNNQSSNKVIIYAANSKYLSIQILPTVALEMISSETGTLKYYIGRYEVTQAQYKNVMGYNPSYSVGDNLPVNNIKWDDCNNFTAKLNNLTGLKFKLPTVNEWMGGAACKENYTYSGSNNLNEAGWWSNNSNGVIHPVGELKPNSWGIFDMSGNAREWCEDLIWGSFRMIKSGDFLSTENKCQLKYYIGANPGITGKHYGFRVILQM